MKALKQTAAVVFQIFQFAPRLNAFGQNLDTDGSGHGQHGACDPLQSLPAFQAAHQRPVYLEKGNGHFNQTRERTMPLAEIVECQKEAGPASRAGGR